MNTTKLYLIGGALFLIILFGWYVFGVIEENGELKQANSNLNQTVKDGEEERSKLKAVAALNSTTLAKVNKEKIILNTYALKKAHELEILKHENAEIKKWSITYVPYVLAGKLFDLTDNDNKNGLYITANGVINADSGTEIEVQNENLYNYANNLKVALRSCNADKNGLFEWYVKAGIILE